MGILCIVAIAWGATISQRPGGIATPYWYNFTSGAPAAYYLAAPTLSANDTACGIAATQTITNKTLTSPTITSPTITGSGAISTSSTVTTTAGLSAGSAADSFLLNDTVELTNVNIKALRATKKPLIATPGADKFIEVVSAYLILDYGSNVLSESTDNLVIQYATSGDDITAAIEMTGFIDQAADTVMAVQPANPLAANAATDMVNNAVELYNTGDGEFGDNAGNDTTMTVKITYRIHKAGL